MEATRSEQRQLDLASQAVKWAGSGPRTTVRSSSSPSLEPTSKPLMVDNGAEGEIMTRVAHYVGLSKQRVRRFRPTSEPSIHFDAALEVRVRQSRFVPSTLPS